MSAIQIAQNTLGEKIPLSKEFFEKLTTKYPDLPSIEELMADEDLMVAPVKVPQKKKSVQKEDRLGEYNPDHCDARIWAAKRGAGACVGYDNVQCFSKKADGTCFCKRHNKKIGEFGSWWLGSINEPRPVNPIGPPGSKDPTQHFWSTDEDGNEVNRKKTKESPSEKDKREVKDAQVKKLEKIKAKKEKDKREVKDAQVKQLEKIKAKKDKDKREIQKLRDELKKRDEKHRSERQEQELRHRGEMRKYEDNRRRELKEQEEQDEKINELLTEIDSSEEEEINVSSDEEEDEGTRQKT